MSLCEVCGNPRSNPERRCGECITCPTLEFDRNAWREMAEKLAEAIRYATRGNIGACPERDGSCGICRLTNILDVYDKLAQEKK